MARVLEATDADFQLEVIERSRTTPVVVDFWAPWCGPCQVLGPILESLAEEHAGDFVLVKVNTDHSPELAAALGVRGIPAVKAFRDGVVVAEFVGAIPAAEVRRFLEAVLPTAADRLVAAATQARDVGDHERARELLEQALEQDKRHPSALMALARQTHEEGIGSGEAGVFATARALYERVPPGVPQRAAAEQALAEIDLVAGEAEAGDAGELRRRLEETPADLEARYSLALAIYQQGDAEGALSELLEIVRADRSFRDDGARQRMLQIFEVLGSDPLVPRFRRELSRLLY